MYEKDTLSALEAITEAQRIAFAPMLFQTALCLRNTGILAWLDKQGTRGASLEEIVANSTLSEYGAGVLLDMGLSGRIVTHSERRYYLAKIGHYLLHDSMTRVNMDFTQDVCYQGLFHLADALKAEKRPGSLSLVNGRPFIRHSPPYPNRRSGAGLLSITSIPMAHLMPRYPIYSQARRQNCTMSAEIRVNGRYAAVVTMKISP